MKRLQGNTFLEWNPSKKPENLEKRLGLGSLLAPTMPKKKRYIQLPKSTASKKTDAKEMNPTNTAPKKAAPKEYGSEESDSYGHLPWASRA